MNQTYCYAIMSGEYIKIGRSDNPYKRLKQLQTASAVPLLLWGAKYDDFNLETKLHNELKDFKVNGEWYQNNQEVRISLGVLRVSLVVSRLERHIDSLNKQHGMRRKISKFLVCVNCVDTPHQNNGGSVVICADTEETPELPDIVISSDCYTCVADPAQKEQSIEHRYLMALASGTPLKTHKYRP